MTASRLRAVLLVGVFLAVAGTAAGFWFSYKSLNEYATSISKLNADSQSGDSNIQTLRKLRTELDARQDVVADARALVADNATYADRAVGDISRIARESGVEITGFEFSDSTTPDAGSAAPSSAPTPSATAPGGAALPQAGVAPTGVTKKTITVAIKSPIKYSNLLNFISKIESNELKLQIATVSMTKDKDDLVATQSFVIGVYVR